MYADEEVPISLDCGMYTWCNEREEKGKGFLVLPLPRPTFKFELWVAYVMVDGTIVVPIKFSRNHSSSVLSTIIFEFRCERCIHVCPVKYVRAFNAYIHDRNYDARSGLQILYQKR